MLSLPLAFILSQDQTLHRILFVLIKSRLIIMRWLSIGSFQISRFYYSYSFALTSLLKRLSIQYVYERVSILFRLFLKAGAKVENLFLTGKCFLKFFLENLISFFPLKPTNLSMNFPMFCGVQSTFFSRLIDMLMAYPAWSFLKSDFPPDLLSSLMVLISTFLSMGFSIS